jgi:Tfp pilus assembly protein PilN
MILINLLPPELMRTNSGFDPMMLIYVAAAILVLASGGLYYYVDQKLVPASQGIDDDKHADLQSRQDEAQKVQDIKDKIADFEKQKDTLDGLLTKKVYWAHTLDDFCVMLDGDWHGDFTVRCTQLSIGPSPKTVPDALAYQFSTNLQVVGAQDDFAGDYIRSLFRTIGKSDFWKHGFTGKPEETYFTDSNYWDSSLKRLLMTFRLTFTRVKPLPKPKPAPDAAQG